VRTRGRLGLKDFDPCTILLNDDLRRRRAAGACRTCTSSTCCRRCTPAGRCGARAALQSYEEVAKKFAKLLGMDPWLIHPMFGQCGQVDFGSARGWTA
jgi:glutamate--cysteine ligase